MTLFKHVILSGLALVLLSQPVLSDQKQVSLSYLSYPPFCGDELPDGGPITEIVLAAFKSQDYVVTKEQLPWSRALDWTKEGKYDAVFTAWFRDDRAKVFAFSDAMPGNELVLFKRKSDNISFKTYADLKPHAIGIVRGYANPPGFEEAGLKLETVNTDKQNLMKLADSRIDLSLTDKAVGKYIMRTELPEKASLIDWIEPPIHVEKQYVMFSRAVPGFEQKRSDFNNGLKAITESGELQNILDKHAL